MMMDSVKQKFITSFLMFDRVLGSNKHVTTDNNEFFWDMETNFYSFFSNIFYF